MPLWLAPSLKLLVQVEFRILHSPLLEAQEEDAALLKVLVLSTQQKEIEETARVLLKSNCLGLVAHISLEECLISLQAMLKYTEWIPCVLWSRKSTLKKVGATVFLMAIFLKWWVPARNGIIMSNKRSKLALGKGLLLHQKHWVEHRKTFMLRSYKLMMKN